MNNNTGKFALVSIVAVVAVLSFSVVMPASDASETGVAKIGSTYYLNLRVCMATS